MNETNINMPVAILMATYNGEKYLAEQIDSIIRQTYSHWHLYIHDDGSTDDTEAILQRYSASYPDKLTVLQYESQGGACNNFISLMRNVDADLYMFADQDDVWHEDKILLTIQSAMVHLSAEHPFLVHTDLCVVDTCMNVLAPSFWQYSHIMPEFVQKLSDHVLNVATGCTMLFNRSLRDIALRYLSPHILMHDSLLLCACLVSGGHVVALHQSTIDYRQHYGNTLGARPADRFTLVYRLRNMAYMLKQNYKQWRMLNVFGRVSIFQYIRTKLRYK